jgi:catechol 2,3-dioxygenase-like lactoylglutathione lyase family enzyme
MGVAINHHIALRTSDIERSARFYKNVFGASALTNPWLLEGEVAEMINRGQPGLKVKLQMLGFESGPSIELYEFVEPVEPTGPIHPTKGTILHIALQVSSVAETLALVEANGGQQVIPEPFDPFGTGSLTFAADPDGNILEITEMSFKEVLEGIYDAYSGTRVA